MDDDAKALLGGILTSLIIERATGFRNSWFREEEERTGSDVSADDAPPGEQFINQALEELLEYRDQVVSRLLK